MTGCGNGSKKEIVSKENYIQSLEKENHISFNTIKNSSASYITSMCYTKVKDEPTGQVFNPCYSCHTKGKIPNYTNDTDLQLEYNFPEEILKNPFTNLFKDRSQRVSSINDENILKYIRKSNYFDSDGNIVLQKVLPNGWKGYMPDCYYHFDDEGFDHDYKNKYTGWRAFRYYPFLGTFWPTNGSTDDVLIRLSKPFRQDSSGAFDKEIYKLNLAIVEAVVKQKDILLPKSVDETQYGVDLNQNGKLDSADKIVYSSENYFKNMSYVGKAEEALQTESIHLAGGLFPESTEFLHSVRYIDWDESSEHIKMATRMKELRYAKKSAWTSYSELERIAKAELWESEVNQETQTQAEVWQGNYEEGLKSGTGWVYQGFIEDIKGALRPQTHEETINCMGCHAGIGATTDTTFAFARKFEGTDKHSLNYGWNHWTQKGLNGVSEPKARYKGKGEVYEYSYYLQNNHSGNEFRDNNEVKKKFFDNNGSLKREMIEKLHNDITLLLFPTKSRALELNKGYKAMVEEQSYIYGRDANVKPMKNVYKEIDEGQRTQIVNSVVQQ